MTMRRRVAWLVAALAAAGLLAGGAAYAVGGFDDDSPAEEREEQAFTEAHEDEVAVTQARAEATALEAQPGTVLESELEREGGRFVWEVEIADGAAIHEVTVDAQDGIVVATEAEGGEDDS